MLIVSLAKHLVPPKQETDLLVGFCFGGRGWIRTTEAESSRFTVCPLWPLGNSPKYLVGFFKQGFSANTLHRIKKGEAINTKTLDALCYALDCEVSDIIEFIKE